MWCQSLVSDKPGPPFSTFPSQLQRITIRVKKRSSKKLSTSRVQGRKASQHHVRSASGDGVQLVAELSHSGSTGTIPAATQVILQAGAQQGGSSSEGSQATMKFPGASISDSDIQRCNQKILLSDGAVAEKVYMALIFRTWGFVRRGWQ